MSLGGVLGPGVCQTRTCPATRRPDGSLPHHHMPLPPALPSPPPSCPLLSSASPAPNNPAVRHMSPAKCRDCGPGWISCPFCLILFLAPGCAGSWLFARLACPEGPVFQLSIMGSKLPYHHAASVVSKAWTYQNRLHSRSCLCLLTHLPC